MSERAYPQVAFLGFAERAAIVRDGETDALKWNVLGLKSILLTNFFPFGLNGWNVALAIRLSGNLRDLKISFKADSGENIGWINIGLVAENPQGPLTRSDSMFLRHVPETWSPLFIPLVGETPLITKPGRYTVVLEIDGNNDESIGEFFCVLVEPAPLTPDRIAAIRANPHAAKTVRAEFGCKFCASRYRVYAALERSPSLEADGFKWYQDITEYFPCECGKTQLDLSTVKRNFFALLGYRNTASAEARYVPLYEKSALESLRVELVSLINADPPEEISSKIYREESDPPSSVSRRAIVL
jgi:hypothetical protein